MPRTPDICESSRFNAKWDANWTKRKLYIERNEVERAVFLITGVRKCQDVHVPKRKSNVWTRGQSEKLQSNICNLPQTHANHTRTHTHTHTNTHTHTHTLKFTHIYTNSFSLTYTHTYIRKHSHKHWHIHTLTYTQTRSHTHTITLTSSNKHIHACSHKNHNVYSRGDIIRSITMEVIRTSRVGKKLMLDVRTFIGHKENSGVQIRGACTKVKKLGCTVAKVGQPSFWSQYGFFFKSRFLFENSFLRSK